MAADPSTRSAGDEPAGHLRGRGREVGQREAGRVGGGRGLGVRSAHPPGAARGLVTWGAPRWPPTPPTFGAPRRSRGGPLNPLDNPLLVPLREGAPFRLISCSC